MSSVRMRDGNKRKRERKKRAFLSLNVEHILNIKMFFHICLELQTSCINTVYDYVFFCVDYQEL